MRKIRYGIVVLCMLLCCSVTTATAQVSIGIGIGLPNLSIGINLPLYPELVPVPGYPVYYAPGLNYNYFFYDGMYWVYMNDNWYASSWYNGPWALVGPEFVPVFILRVPVRYYRYPPAYFRGWRADAPPRWGEHWGRGWEQNRRGWDRWNRSAVPARAPLPTYQRQYTGDRYPRQVEQQRTLHREQYRYQPRDKVIKQHYQQQGGQRAPAPAQRGRQEEPRMRGPEQQGGQRGPAPAQRGRQEEPLKQEIKQPQRQAPQQQEIKRQAPQQQAPQQQRGPAPQERREQPGAVQREQQAPRPQGQEPRVQERGRPQQQEPGRGQGEGQKREEERGRER